MTSNRIPIRILRVVALGALLATTAAVRAADDASMPWDLAELHKAPAFEWVDEKSPVRSLMYEGPAYKDKPTTKVFAYYATPGTLAGDPSKDKDLPAVVLIHGGGGTAFAEWAQMWAQRGYAAIAMDLGGSRPIEGKNPHDRANRERLDLGGPGQGHDEKFHAVGKPVTEHWCYHAVANVIRAHSLVRSFPEVDAEKTAVTGISWGGYLTCMTASIDGRFKAGVPVYGCGYLHENSKWLHEFKRLGPDMAAKWVKLYDPSRYLGDCTAAMFFVNGTNDFAYPLDSYMKSYRLVPGPKQIRIEVGMKHSHPAGWDPIEIGLFVDGVLGRGEPLGRDDWIDVAGAKKIELSTTTDRTPINARKWTTVDTGGKGVDKIAPTIGNDVTAWFLTATDGRGATVTSAVIIRDPGPPVRQ